MSTQDHAVLPFPLAAGESLVRSGGANMQRGAETAGGKLFLTTERLVFVGHAFNVRSGPSEVPLALIAEVGTAWTKLLGVIPLMPNSIAVTLRDGTVLSYVVTGRTSWIEAIAQARGGGVHAG
ncbi:hypothetical protein [uncultured Brachybacterium sp.]|uniref:hypothetical protein n=1 Tax=uncultured Brachybacterium sp. TaxID=189680 RepID=UPI00262907DE|nr:hypothetical protein [uncultured Brachybacterium sp.]